jgi:hypothetical protein
MRCEYTQKCWEPKRYITQLLDEQEPESVWKEQHAHHFEIDGPGGEIVTNIFGASDAEGPQAIKVSQG